MMKLRKLKTLSIHCTASLMTVLLLGWPAVAQADYRVLHHFAGGANDGAGPLLGRLIQSGETLYGMTATGGSNDLGTVFRMNTDGTGFAVLHSFTSAATDGQRPYGSLLLSGSTLYGMAACENTSYNGTLFKIGMDGAGFQVLHRFTGSEGKWPYDTLIQDGAVLYGLCTYGGSSAGSGWVGNGTIFKMNTDGSGFQRLKVFTGGASDGGGPHGSLIRSSTVLYGTTLWGGSSNGAVFKMNTDGTSYGLLHSFAGGSSDGRAPYGTTLLQSGSTLYGMTELGGASDNGTVFKVETDGTQYQLLHSFAGGNSGSRPMCGTLVKSGPTLYGMTTDFGGSGVGTLFQVDTDGAGFQLLHSFEVASGSRPWGSLLLSNSVLYGMTTEGGVANQGVIFAVGIDRTRRVPDRYPTVQAAIDAAQAGDTIQLAPGTYHENVMIAGKDVTLQSNNPADPNLTARTIIEGNGTDPAVKLENCTPQCVLAGLTIRGGGTGLWCSGGKPVIRSCQIVENAGSGIELLAGAQPSIDHCIIAANGGYGLKLTRGLSTVLVNCTIVQNVAGAIFSGTPAVRNSILYFNGPQVAPQGSQMTYSCVEDGFPGDGNFDMDPLFARLGRWTEPGDVNHPAATWIAGDYHLLSEAGRWDPDLDAWVQDGQASPCIDSGDPAFGVASEPVPNGGWINVGAYGGTSQASRTPALMDPPKPDVTEYAVAFSTYFGKSAGNPCVAAGQEGTVYVSGTTRDPDFPTTPGAYCRTLRGESDVFVAKFASDGPLLYSTLIGGSKADIVGVLKVDDLGDVYLWGTTSSADFPTTAGAYDRNYDASLQEGNGFILKLDPSGSNLIFSTFFPAGSSGSWQNQCVQFDKRGNILLAGNTSSATFPTTPGAYSRVYKGVSDAFVCRLNADGGQLLSSTLFGGSGMEQGVCLALDQDQNIFLAGCSGSTNLPITANAIKKQLNGTINGFFAKFDPDLATLLYSSFYGGSAAYNFVHSMFCTPQNKLYISGQSYSTDIPVTANAWQSRLGGDADLYITVLDARTMAMPYSTYFGGNAEELGPITSMGNDLVVAHGLTGSSNFSLTGHAWHTSAAGAMKPFFSILDIGNPKANQLVYSTYLDADLPLAADEQGNIYLFGEVSSVGYPVTPGAFQAQPPGSPAFVLTKLQP